VLAVRDFTNANINHHSPEELIEQLAYIWVVDHPAVQNVYGLGEMSGGGRSVAQLLTEAKKAEDLLIMKGASAIPALLSVSKLSDRDFNHLSMRDRLHDRHDQVLFAVQRTWGTDRETRHNDWSTRTLRYRPCLARQGAIRVLKQMGENPV